VSSIDRFGFMSSGKALASSSSYSPVNITIFFICLFAAESNEEVYNDPVVIIKRSHSLVGPTSLVSRSLRLSKLSLGKTAGSSELAKCLSEEKEGEQGQLSDEEFDDFGRWA
jgi:hypothetical protein